MKKLAKALRDREMSITDACKATGLGDQQIRNLVRKGQTRQTLPSSVKAGTMVRLLEVFDELDLDDFLPGTVLSVR